MSGIPASGVAGLNALLSTPLAEPIGKKYAKPPVALMMDPESSITRKLWGDVFPMQRDAIAKMPGVNFTRAHQLGADTACAGRA